MFRSGVVARSVAAANGAATNAMMGMKGVAGAASEGGTADKKSRTAYAKNRTVDAKSGTADQKKSAPVLPLTRRMPRSRQGP